MITFLLQKVFDIALLSIPDCLSLIASFLIIVNLTVAANLAGVIFTN